MIEAAEYQLFRESKKKPKTLDRLKQGWNCFCKHIGMEDWRFTDKINTTREYRPEAISNADVVKMLEFCKHAAETAKTVTERVRWSRIEIMMLLGWGSGFRSCEYGNATFEEIINTGFVTIRNSKHDGTRRVPVTDETQEAVSRLKAILHENGLAPKNGGIFEKSNGETYSTSTFRRWLKKVAIACGVSCIVAKTHGLRHRFAKNFHGFTKDELMLADLMGHKSIETTRKYAEETSENQRKAVLEANNNARAILLQAA